MYMYMQFTDTQWLADSDSAYALACAHTCIENAKHPCLRAHCRPQHEFETNRWKKCAVLKFLWESGCSLIMHAYFDGKQTKSWVVKPTCTLHAEHTSPHLGWERNYNYDMLQPAVWHSLSKLYTFKRLARPLATSTSDVLGMGHQILAYLHVAS